MFMNEGNIRSLDEKLSKETPLIKAVDAVLAWWDKHKDDTFTYNIGEYAYDGDTFDSAASDLFENLRKARG